MITHKTQYISIVFFLFISIFCFTSSSHSQYKPAFAIPEMTTFSADSVEIDAEGRIYFTDFQFARVIIVEHDGIGGLRFVSEIGSRGSGDGEFIQPRGLAFDPDGNLFVLDLDTRIQVFEPDGMGGYNFKTKFGTAGSGDGEFSAPFGIDIDQNGDIYIADQGNNRIQIFEPDGVGGFQFKTKFGTAGSGDGEFSFPQGVYVDENVDVYVSDGLNHRIQVFEPDGLGGFQFKTKFGTMGTGDGEFNIPVGLFTDTNGDVYIADQLNNRIQIFEPDGLGGFQFKTKFGMMGSNDGELAAPAGIILDSMQNIYIADQTPKFSVFEPDGFGGFQFLTKFQTIFDGGLQSLSSFRQINMDSSGNIFATSRKNILVFEPSAPEGLTLKTIIGSEGSGDGQFEAATGVAIDSANNVYTSDTLNDNIQVFEPDGMGGYLFKASFGSMGSGDGQFSDPSAVAVDSNGNVFVADRFNQRIQVLEPDGMDGLQFKTKFGSLGSGNNNFISPRGIAVDSNDDLYVVDNGNDRIQVFEIDASCNFIYKTTIGSFGTGDGEFDSPVGINVDGNGNVYVTDTGNDRVHVFEPDGGGGFNFVEKFSTLVFNQQSNSNALGIIPKNNGETLIVSDTFHLAVFTKLPLINIEKMTLPGGGDNFDFTSSGFSGLDFCELDDNFQIDNGEIASCVTPIDTGYQVSEPVPAGRVLDITCNGTIVPTFTPNPPTGIKTTGIISFDTTSNDDVLSCTFINSSDIDDDGTADFDEECPNDPGKTVPGICGCGTADTDTDSDGTPDCNDLCVDDPDKTEPGECGCGIPEGCNAGDDDDETIDDTEPNSPPDIETGGGGTTIEIINEDDNNPLGPVTINIDLPDGILPQSAVGNPPSTGTTCSIFNTQTARIADEDIDISCQVDNIDEELELFLGLCNDGSDELVAEAIIEIISPDLNEDQEDIIEIIVNQLNACELVLNNGNDNGDSGDEGCTLAPSGSKPSYSGLMFLLLPAFLFIRRRYL